MSKIQWTERTWNPTRGCRRISPGCVNCYAEKVATRFCGEGLPYEGLIQLGKWNGETTFAADKLTDPLSWQKPALIFVDSMSDLFYEGFSAAQIDQVLAVMNSIPGVVCPKPQGAFYVFPDISCAFGKSHGSTKIENDVDLCNALLEAKGVACVPGSAFGEPRALRISYTCPTAQLPEGLKRFREFFAELS